MTEYTSQAAPLLQPLWEALVRAVGADTVGHPLFFVMAVLATVVVVGLAFSFVDVFVTKKMPFKTTGVYLLITLPGYVAAYLLLRWIPIKYRFEVPASAPTLPRFAFDLVLCFVIGDLLSYWWHRLEHASPLVFKRVHYVHHRVQRPLSVWSGFYVHPVESLCVFVTFYIYPFVFRVHPLTFAAYAVSGTFVMMVTHCGYDLPLYPKAIFASALMHEIHHGSGKPHNFSVLLSLSDRLFGTFAPFSAQTSLGGARSGAPPV